MFNCLVEAVYSFPSVHSTLAHYLIDAREAFWSYLNSVDITSVPDLPSAPHKPLLKMHAKFVSCRGFETSESFSCSLHLTYCRGGCGSCFESHWTRNLVMPCTHICQLSSYLYGPWGVIDIWFTIYKRCISSGFSAMIGPPLYNSYATGA